MMRHWWVVMIAGLAVCLVSPTMSSINTPVVEMSAEHPATPSTFHVAEYAQPDELLVVDTVYLTDGIAVSERLLPHADGVVFHPGHLAAGVRVAEDGSLSGTARGPGTYVARVRGCVGVKCSESDLTLVVYANVPWQPRELTFPGRVGVPLRGEIGIEGGPPGALPTFTVTDHSKLPRGVSIGPDGAVSGTPAAGGVYEVPVQICVAGNCAGVVVQMIIV
ncbi:putative Ig domain-containing protein [Nonomuraea maritima]|nr:putative Ig domain-containing protein [Nonomuraea maritima]